MAGEAGGWIVDSGEAGKQAGTRWWLTGPGEGQEAGAACSSLARGDEGGAGRKR